MHAVPHFFYIKLKLCSVLIQVGHVQHVSVVPDRTHEMKTLSLKPLLFGK